MSRWHEPDCLEPDVFVEKDLPCCRACGQSADTSFIDKMVAQRALTVTSIPSTPSDRHDGEVVLGWPPQVPWSVTSGTDHGSNKDSSDGILESHNTSISPTVEHAGRSFGSSEGASRADNSSNTTFTHDKTLDPNEIRLICFDSVDDDNTAIHFDLEVYQRGESPEYETVSYTWTDENGDDTLCKPVFVGRHWDVLLQTRNCWSVLQYLRPIRGIRLVWVDAICINQDDFVERESQVASMGEIYSQCTRVVIWLGDDLVTQTSKRARRRYPFEEIQSKVQEIGYLEEVFRRRYFSRVWIIQELVMAPSSVLPLLDMDFMIRALTPKLFPKILSADT